MQSFEWLLSICSIKRISKRTLKGASDEVKLIEPWLELDGDAGFEFLETPRILILNRLVVNLLSVLEQV